MTELLPSTPHGLDRAASLIGGGALVAFPTDTVYGVAVAAGREDRLDALYELKARPAEKRIAMLVAGLDQVEALGWMPDGRARLLAERFWPGGLTLVLTGSDGATQGFRAPDHPVTLELIRRSGPLLTTSANRSSEPDTLAADEVLIAFALQQDELAAVVDGGPVPGGRPSTVIDLSVTPARVLRIGPIARNELANTVDVTPEAEVPTAAPTAG
ncbi:MAG: L-threonylcarbamoyladenylate synthase [Candidatus Limnocylindria bacterium]